ncbi:hypothetical protein IRZ53_09690 [Pseudomonas fulva]|uniref:hypothetical protein n=1 Tax=Pseudomonas fulva TaxID=47880 RepID=UPI0018ABC180|nr:hypothetical protein [Pseudomonas fulva]MBF8674541.1 hypothetical protein [Pseudomonas fulva]MBF8697060.1 hypothetical protein [Pseudomonas fulva]
MNTDYFHHATFEEPEGWAGWQKEANGQTLQLIADGNNHFLAFANEGSTPHGSVLSKVLEGLEPEREYWVSLRARQLRQSDVIPTLTWMLGGNKLSGSGQVTSLEWETLHWSFRPTQGSEKLVLEVRESTGSPSLPRGNLAIDDIRIYPTRYEENFNALQPRRINPGEQMRLNSMIVTLLPGSKGQAGILKHSSDEDRSMREGEALALSIGQDYPQRMRIDLPGEYTSVSFAWTWLQKNATVDFIDRHGNVVQQQHIDSSAGYHQWVHFRGIEAKSTVTAIARVELTYSDWSYLDFFSLNRELLRP